MLYYIYIRQRILHFLRSNGLSDTFAHKDWSISPQVDFNLLYLLSAGVVNRLIRVINIYREYTQLSSSGEISGINTRWQGSSYNILGHTFLFLCFASPSPIRFRMFQSKIKRSMRSRVAVERHSAPLLAEVMTVQAHALRILRTATCSQLSESCQGVAWRSLYVLNES
jgi:hypothetical protein